jgi:branched-chain amino acid transport system permease protein
MWDFIGRIREFYWRNEKWLIMIFVALLPCVMLLGPTQYIYRVLTVICLYAVLGLSLNIILGYTGMLSMGHAAYYAIGAYTSALMSTKMGVSFFLSAPAGALVAAFFGFLFGLPTLRLQGSYLAITTMGFAEVVRMTLLSWESLTNGAFGIQRIARPRIFGLELTTANGGLYLLAAIMLIATVYISCAIHSSKMGRALRAIKDDALATTLMGVNVNAYRVAAFSVSAGVAGIAGALYASIARFIDPNVFSFDTSMMTVCIVILGGMGSVAGILIGAVALCGFPEILRGLDLYRFVVYGLILIIMMRFRPQGLLGGLTRKPYKFPGGVASRGKEGAVR